MRSHPHVERPGLPILGMVSQAGMCVMASCKQFLASVAQIQEASGYVRAVGNGIGLMEEQVYDDSRRRYFVPRPLGRTAAIFSSTTSVGSALLINKSSACTPSESSMAPERITTGTSGLKRFISLASVVPQPSTRN